MYCSTKEWSELFEIYFRLLNKLPITESDLNKFESVLASLESKRQLTNFRTYNYIREKRKTNKNYARPKKSD